MGTMNQLAPNIPISKIIFVGSEKTHMLALLPREHLHVPSRILYFILMQY